MRHCIQLFITAYIGFISTFVVIPQWTRFKNSIPTMKDIDQLFRMHNEALDASIKGFFLMDSQLLMKMAKIACICIQFIEDTKKWSKSVDNDIIDKQQKVQMASPLFNIYDAFEKAVRALISELLNMANREANDIYSDFVNWININNYYYQLPVY